MLFLRTKYRCAAFAPYPPSHTHTRTTHILTTVQQQHWSAHGCVEKNLMVSKVLSGQRVKHITAVFTETEPDGTNVSLKNSSPHLQKHLFLQLPGGYYNSCHYARPSFLSAEQPLQQQIPLNVLRQTMQSYRRRAGNGHNLAAIIESDGREAMWRSHVTIILIRHNRDSRYRPDDLKIFLKLIHFVKDRTHRTIKASLKMSWWILRSLPNK